MKKETSVFYTEAHRQTQRRPCDAFAPDVPTPSSNILPQGHWPADHVVKGRNHAGGGD